MGLNRNLGNITEVIKESGGKIGIGNSIPIRKLEVASDGANWISGTFSGTGNTNKVVIGNLTTPTIGGHNAALNAWTDFTIAGDSIIFAPFGTEKMRVNGSGNVGIGAASPKTTLQASNIGSSGSLPSLGSIGTGTSLYLTNNNYGYGLLMGSLPTGNSWIQTQRTDASATSYNLILQPNGSNVLVGTTTDSGQRLQVNGDIKASNAVVANFLALLGNYNTNVNTDSSWSSYQTIIPPGTLDTQVTYMISIRWNYNYPSSNQPYHCYCSFLWMGAYTNGPNTDNEFTPICSTHTGGTGANISFRSIAATGGSTSGIQARLNSFPTLGGVMTVKATRLE